jgi:predicted metal-dependent phosphoesterase TrpH
VHYHALTDHDSTEGIAEAAAAGNKHADYHLIPGVEFGTDIEGAEIHMLGLFLSPDDSDLQGILKELRDGRLDRGEGIVNKLREQGYMIEWSRVQEIAGDAAVGRPHIAQALVEGGYVKKVADAFDRLIGRNGTAYVERRKMTPADAVEFIIARGGLACWAHPADMGIKNDQIEPILKGLKAAGMQAMEVFYKDYSPATIDFLHGLTKTYDLLPLGGSDYHGIFGNEERLPGDIPLPDTSVERLLELGRTLPNGKLVS